MKISKSQAFYRPSYTRENRGGIVDSLFTAFAAMTRFETKSLTVIGRINGQVVNHSGLQSEPQTPGF